MSTLGERIRQARGDKSQDTFAKLLGISKGSLGFYERNENLPNIDVVLKICSIANVSLDWLVSGTDFFPGVPPLAVGAGNSPQTIEAQDHQIIMIPMVEARLSAGHGSFETDSTSERQYSFRSDFLLRKGNISQMVLMRVSGDSMAPAVEDSDVVLIDQSQNKPIPGKVYAVGVEDMVYLKRVNAEPGKLVLLSDNKGYAPMTIDTRGDLESNIRIIGRVIWCCREM